MAQDPKAKEPAAEGEAPAPKSKKKLIIIIAAVVVLLAGAGGGWYFMKSKEAAKKPAKHGEVHEEAEAAKAKCCPVYAESRHIAALAR
jgi:flagellar FliL protein